MNKAEKAVVLTWLLVPMLIGVFIGGAVSGNTSLMIWSAVLFFADMAVGSLLKRRAERQTEEEVWNIWRGMSSAEKSAAANELLDRLRQELKARGINVGRPAAVSDRCPDAVCRADGSSGAEEYAGADRDEDNDEEIEDREDSEDSEDCEECEDCKDREKRPAGERERMVRLRQILNSGSDEQKRAAANELLDRLRRELKARGINVGRAAAGSSGCEENGEGNAERLKSGERLEELCRTLRNGSGAHFGKEATVIPGTRRVRSIGEDEAGRFLLGFCRLVPHAPPPNTLSRLWLVSARNLDGAPALLYTFHHDRHSVCQNAEIILVHTGNGKIRLFALETDYSAYVLCEYDENRHINYGRIAMEDFLPRVRELLKQPVPPIPL